MAIQLANNAVSHLAAALASTDLSLSVTAGQGALFPSLTAGDTFPATLVDSSGNIEIVTVTARTGDAFTITRGQENTLARAFLAGDRIELRLTAATFMSVETTANSALSASNANTTHLSTVDSEITTLNSDVSSINSQISTINSEIAALQSGGFPVGFGPLPWSRPALPSGWIWADGSVLLSNTTYTALRNAYISDGFPFGQDGSGNPKVPDMRGRVGAGTDNMGGTAANRLTTTGSGIAGTTLGAAGGEETHTLTSAQQASMTVSGSASVSVSGSISGSANPGRTIYDNVSNSGGTVGLGASADGGALSWPVSGTFSGTGSGSISGTASGGGGAHNNTQPTLVVGYIIKT